MMTCVKESFATTKLEREKGFRNSKNNNKWKKRKKSLIKIKMNKKINKVKNNHKKKMSSKKTINKNLILTLQKMIIKTFKESEKYVNMTKKLKKIKNENQISKNKEIKSQQKLKISITNSLKLKDNLKFIKRKNY